MFVLALERLEQGSSASSKKAYFSIVFSFAVAAGKI